MPRIALIVAACAIAVASCGRSSRPSASGAAEAGQPAPAPAAGPASSDDTGHPKIVALGDSLTAGHGLLEMQAYPAILQDRLQEDGYAWDVVNAGVSGDTSAAGLQRFDWALQQAPGVRILILELGANDGLRGLPVAEMKKNLAAIIERAQERKLAVLLVGMEAPPNFGLEYAGSFRQAYRDLAREYRVTFIPFMLDKVAGVPSLNQSDGIHPNVDGTRMVADTIWSALRPMVDAAGGS
jgi:acyl-CoA thioesterase-1